MYKFDEYSNEPIYKYIPLKYLLKMLQSANLYVGKVEQWEDVYENFFLKQHFVYNGQKERLVMDDIVRKCFSGIFGQSWTSCRSSDAMWRIYSKTVGQGRIGKFLQKSSLTIGDISVDVAVKCLEDVLQDTSVRITTTPRMLYDELRTSRIFTQDMGVELQKVQYRTCEVIDKWLDSIYVTSTSMVGYIIASLFTKRMEFQHEQEVRLFIHVKSTNAKSGENALVVPINPLRMIKEYVMDPRLDAKQCEHITNLLVKQCVERRFIRQSTLYKLKPKTLILAD